MAGLFTEFKKTLRAFGIEYFGRYYSIYRAVVFDNQDPEFNGRLRVVVPQLFGKKSPKKWAVGMGQIAGKKGGVFWVPSIGDPIYVMFEGGDPSRPVWTYGWWLSGSSPEDAKRENPNNYVFQTPSGHRLELDDENEYIRIENKDGMTVELSKDGMFLGNNDSNLGELLQELFSTFEKTTVISYPLDNIVQYTVLKEKFKNLVISNAIK